MLSTICLTWNQLFDFSIWSQKVQIDILSFIWLNSHSTIVFIFVCNSKFIWKFKFQFFFLKFATFREIQLVCALYRIDFTDVTEGTYPKWNFKLGKESKFSWKVGSCEKNVLIEYFHVCGDLSSVKLSLKWNKSMQNTLKEGTCWSTIIVNVTFNRNRFEIKKWKCVRQ